MKDLSIIDPKDNNEDFINSLNNFFRLHESECNFIPLYGNQLKHQVTQKIYDYIVKNCQTKEKSKLTGIAAALPVLRILMRERIEIDSLLNINSMELYIQLAERTYSCINNDIQMIETIQTEAIKCAINWVYDRPKEVEIYSKQNGFQNILNLLQYPRSATFHGLVCTCLRFACGESNEVIRSLHLPSYNTLGFLIPTLIFAISDEEQCCFPHGKGRLALIQEILKLLYALATVENFEETTNSNIEMMTELGVALNMLLTIPNFPSELMDIKLLVINVLMYMPAQYCHYLVQHNAIQSLAHILLIMVDMVLIEKVRMNHELTPLMIVLNNIISKNEKAKIELKDIIFPQEDEIWLQEQRELTKQKDIQRLFNAINEEEKEKIKMEIRDRTIHPEDRRKDQIKGKLFRLMTSIEPTIKRYTSELIYTLCDNNAEEFTRRTGMGNAVALLKLKGIV